MVWNAYDCFAVVTIMKGNVEYVATYQLFCAHTVKR